jgi:hypothetical protein
MPERFNDYYVPSFAGIATSVRIPDDLESY